MDKEQIKQQILEAYMYRHACKEFDSDLKISSEDFAFILETGRLSPSSFGLEPWKFVVVQNKALREKLLPITWGGQKQIPTSSHFVILLSRTKADMLPDSEYIGYNLETLRKMPPETANGLRGFYQKFLESDFKLLEHDRLVFEWTSRQTYIALGNMMTTAAQIGIDSCPIEGFDQEKVEALLQEEGILDGGHFGVSCMVAFGYRIREPRPKTRRPIEEAAQWIE